MRRYAKQDTITKSYIERIKQSALRAAGYQAAEERRAQNLEDDAEDVAAIGGRIEDEEGYGEEEREEAGAGGGVGGGGGEAGEAGGGSLGDKYRGGEKRKSRARGGGGGGRVHGASSTDPLIGGGLTKGKAMEAKERQECRPLPAFHVCLARLISDESRRRVFVTAG